MTGGSKRSGTEQARQPFLFVGNHPWLDFINTQLIVRGEPIDLLECFEDLMQWLVQAKLLGPSEGEAVACWESTVRERCFDDAIAFRRTLRTLAERIVAGQPISDSTVAAINRFLARCPGYPQITYARGHFERHFHSEAKQAARLLAPLAEAMSDLLCSGNLSLVKKCGNHACILYFYDTTKNHARNWCSMQLCGNRMKVAAHYRRKQRTKR